MSEQFYRIDLDHDYFRWTAGLPEWLVPVELLTADEQATIMYACQHSDAGRLTRPEEVELVSLVRTLIERIGGDDGDR